MTPPTVVCQSVRWFATYQHSCKLLVNGHPDAHECECGYQWRTPSAVLRLALLVCLCLCVVGCADRALGRPCHAVIVPPSDTRQYPSVELFRNEASGYATGAFAARIDLSIYYVNEALGHAIQSVEAGAHDIVVPIDLRHAYSSVEVIRCQAFEPPRERAP